MTENLFPERISGYDAPEHQTISAYIRQIVTIAVSAGNSWENVETATARIVEQINSEGITGLVEQSGTNSQDHGFHDDKPDLADFVDTERGHQAYENALRNFWIAKLDLIHEELAEMLGELRSGRAPGEVYYVSKANNGIEFSRQAYDEKGVPVYKPEGFGIELADVVIRAADLAFLTKLPLAELIAIKHEYNRSRSYKHGRKL